MRWLQTEYILKGVFLGLLSYVALQVPSWADTAWVALFTFGGLFLALGATAVARIRQGVHVGGRLLSFFLYLLLDNPFLVYLGIVLGLAVGAFWLPRQEENEYLLAQCVGGGVALGILFYFLAHVRDRNYRLVLSLGMAVALALGVVFWVPDQVPEANRAMFGVILLLGIPLFYFLTFAGLAEESEVEIAAVCALLFGGLWMVGGPDPFASPQYGTFAVAFPVLVYLLYSWKFLPGLRVFKHVVRGLSYARVGKFRPALVRLKRALHLDPRNALARETLWMVHRAMDFDQIAQDPQTLALVDFDLCLERAGSLLLRQGPRPEHLREAQRLLDLVSRQRPQMQPACDYWRAVAFTHAHQYEQAAAALEAVVTPSEQAADNPYRREILMSAWQLALTLHPEMKRRVGTPQLAQPGRRMEAIAAVERHLAKNPEDGDAWNLKRVLYSELTEVEYEAAAGPEKPAPDFDHGYAQQLGLALIEDPERWRRGAEYLRIAARGLPTLGPALFMKIAKAHERAGDVDGVWHNYRMVKQVGRAAGPKNLSPEDYHTYFAVVKLLGEEAANQGNIDQAIDDFLLYREYERSGKETYRALANLYEQKKDVWAALHAAEQGLVYDPRDRDLLEKKDKYYYSVTPEELRERWETVYKYFDVNYCLTKAQAILKSWGTDLDMLDWAQHLATLAKTVQKDSLTARVTLARILLLRGEKDQAQAMLEQVRKDKPEKFASKEDEDSWYTTCKLLGTMYLHELHRPELAVECLLDFRKSSKSGADTMYRLGQAYEELGDRARAIKCYRQVTTFESHPLAPDAQDALQRLQAQV